VSSYCSVAFLGGFEVFLEEILDHFLDGGVFEATMPPAGNRVEFGLHSRFLQCLV